MAGQSQSKWLRDEADDTWETRIRREKFTGENYSNAGKEIIMKSDYRGGFATTSREESKKLVKLNEANIKGYSSMTNILYELNEETSEDIQLEDRKRRRGISIGLDHTTKEIGLMDVDLGQQNHGIQTLQMVMLLFLLEIY